jgi:hypothetical protein
LGYLLVSRLEACQLRDISLDAAALKGLLTLEEWRQLDALGRAVPGGTWHWPQGTPDCARVVVALAAGGGGGLAGRLRVLTAMVELLHAQLPTLNRPGVILQHAKCSGLSCGVYRVDQWSGRLLLPPFCGARKPGRCCEL